MSPIPWSYTLCRLLFKITLKIFYGSIVIENADLIPKTGEPCIVCVNHGNSLTDAIIMIMATPTKTRGMLRTTAKSTLFGKKTLASWLIQNAGALPIARRSDFEDGQITQVDNSPVLEKLMTALEQGDAVLMFPEGVSRYHPFISPLKTGVARLCANVLNRQRNNPDFEISILNCSITYTHRQHFRSDVVVTFHPPMRLRPSTNPELLEPVEFEQIRLLTSRMYRQISSGTLNSPSWDLTRTAKLAALMYAPLGTRMGLGDHVRLVATFLEAFKNSLQAAEFTADNDPEDEGVEARQMDQEFARLIIDLKAYQRCLSHLGIKDDRVRQPLHRWILVQRMLVRLCWSLVLFSLCLPGMVLWLPVFLTTYIPIRKLKKTGPVWNTWDEISQYKMLYGLVTVLAVWGTCVLVTVPISLLTAPLVPTVMWLSLRWFEDAVSASRACVVLGRLLWAGDRTMANVRSTREDLYRRVVRLATSALGLPDDPEAFFLSSGGYQKGRSRGRWESRAKYFSVKRRRKKDWNETLRLHEVDYAEAGE